VDEHPIDHPFVENDEGMSDEPDERQKRRRWPVAVVSVLVVIVAIGAALYLAASHYQPLSQNARRWIRLANTFVQRNARGESARRCERRRVD